VDTAGLLLAVVITAASVQDRHGARPLLWNLQRHSRQSVGGAAACSRSDTGLNQPVSETSRRAQVGITRLSVGRLTKPMHHSLWIFLSVNQPRGVRMPHLVGGSVRGSGADRKACRWRHHGTGCLVPAAGAIAM
jgi:hypothetical protein